MEKEKKSTYKGYTESVAKATKKWNDAHVQFSMRITPEQRDEIRAYAESRGESVTGFILRAIKEQMERDKVKDNDDNTKSTSKRIKLI